MTLGLFDLGFLGGLGGGAPWTPANITTALWLDAADESTITASGSDVTQVNDKSGNDRNFTSASGTRPATGIDTQNGKNILSFSASRLTSASTSETWKFLHDATGSSVFSVARFGITSDPNTIYGLLGNNSLSSANIGYLFAYDDRAAQSRSDAAVFFVTAGIGASGTSSNSVNRNAITPNTQTILSVIGDPSNATAANRSIIRINGGEELKANTSSGTLSDANPSFTLQIGAGGNNTLSLTGAIAEIIILSGIISSTDRERIEGYLAHKWGLTANLPNDHLFKTVAPTT
jgi:hypothetical protein